MVPGKGLEPLLPRGEPDFESGASANFATPARRESAFSIARPPAVNQIRGLPNCKGRQVCDLFRHEPALKRQSVGSSIR